MRWVAVAAAVLFLALVFLARRESAGEEKKKLLRPFYRVSMYLYKRACIYKLPFFSGKQVVEDLVRIYPGKNRDKICTEYYVDKLARSLMICLAGTFLGLVVSLRAQGMKQMGEDNGVTRGTYEDGERSLELECRLPGGVKRFRVQVMPRELCGKELEETYRSFQEALPELILGENVSCSEISSDLSLRDAYEGYPFQVEWSSNHVDCLHSDGVIEEPEEAQKVVLTAYVSYGEWRRETEIAVTVIPPVLSEEEKLQRDLEKLVADTEKKDRPEEKWYLPESWQGEELQWRERVKDRGPLLWIGAMAAAAVVYLMADHDLHEVLEQRRQGMRREYPDVIHKLTLYLGAGMTIRSAFRKMAEDYEKGRKEGKRASPVYEEMLYACRELQAGVSEGAVYEHFGKRTGIQEYIRLSTLLTQNLKKGNSGLLPRLREEAEKASQDHMQYGKRLGEEAVTKLLLPMVMMLLVVMLMIMIPAFSSVGT